MDPVKLGEQSKLAGATNNFNTEFLVLVDVEGEGEGKVAGWLSEEKIRLLPTVWPCSPAVLQSSSLQ